MLKNYFKIALRNLIKHKSYTLINALGLAVGMASCLLILVILQFEFSFDNYHINRDKVYRLTDHIRTSGTNYQHTAATPLPWGPAIAADFPEVESFARFIMWGRSLKHGENLITQPIVYTDPGVFDLFTYPLVKGDPKSALSHPYSLIISEKMATKYFGEKDPVGQTMLIDNQDPYLITAIMKNVPNNSFYPFIDFMASMSSLEKDGWRTMGDWKKHSCRTFVMLAEGSDPVAVDKKFSGFLTTYLPEDTENHRLELQPFSDLHLAPEISGNWGDNLDMAYIYIFSAIAFFILLIACINFMNLATARSANRAREVGMRKVLGAFRSQLIRQFLLESIIISFLALLIAIVFVELTLPWFNSLTDRGIQINYLENIFYLGALFAVALLTGVISGSYPAFFLSRHKPASILKGSQAFSTRGISLRKVLVVTQFSIAIFMIIANVVLYQQVDYLRSKDLGFKQDNIIFYAAPNNNAYKKQNTIKNELQQESLVSSVFTSSHEPGDGAMSGRFLPEGVTDEKGLLLDHIAIDEDYLTTLDIELIQGRNFSAQIASDTTQSILINETFAKHFGWQEPVGKKIEWLNDSAGKRVMTVIGVTRDFHFQSLHQPIQPLIMHKSPSSLWRYHIAVKPGQIEEAKAMLMKRWQVYDPNNAPFHYFLSEDLELEYRFETMLVNLLQRFTFFTIFIACLGLLGLAAFTAEQRTKEIGIRKVLGASVNSIVALISKEFIFLVAIANLIAWPLAYFAMDSWLRSFAYHIPIGFLSFFMCSLAAILIAWLTIGFQATRAAFANPIQALRYE